MGETLAPQPSARSFWEKLAETWPARVAQSAYKAVTLPGDVYAGRVDPRSDDGIGRAADLAGMVMGGTFGMAPAGAIGAGPVRGRRLGKADFESLVRKQRTTEAQAAMHPLIHATPERFDAFRTARQLGKRANRGEEDVVWFGRPDDVNDLTSLFGANVAEIDLPSGVTRSVKWRDYDADPTYVPGTMAQLLKDYADDPVVAIRGVSIREGSEPTTIYAVRDPTILGPPRWRLEWDKPVD